MGKKEEELILIERFKYILLLISIDTINSIIYSNKMLTKTQEQILEFLLGNPEEQITIRGVAKKLKKSYPLVYNNLVDLEKKEIIKKKSIPPAHIITLNEFAPPDIYINIEFIRKNKFLEKQLQIKLMLKDILKTTEKFFILLVFGSYAKEKSTLKSDLDLLIIVQDKEDIKEIETVISKTYTKIKKSVNFVDIGEFKEMIKNSNELNIGNESKKHHIILYGAEQYYSILRSI